jgi:hypothetical protein
VSSVKVVERQSSRSFQLRTEVWPFGGGGSSSAVYRFQHCGLLAIGYYSAAQSAALLPQLPAAEPNVQELKAAFLP